MHRRVLIVVVAMSALAGATGCGTDEPPPTERAVQRPQHPLVFLSRAVGTDPMADQVTVGTDGRVAVRRQRGGAGGRFDFFRLTPGELRGLRTELGRIGARGRTPRQDLKRWWFTLRVRDQVARQYVGGRVPRRVRPAIRRLEQLIDSSPERAAARR